MKNEEYPKKASTQYNNLKGTSAIDINRNFFFVPEGYLLISLSISKGDKCFNLSMNTINKQEYDIKISESLHYSEQLVKNINEKNITSLNVVKFKATISIDDFFKYFGDLDLYLVPNILYGNEKIKELNIVEEKNLN